MVDDRGYMLPEFPVPLNVMELGWLTTGAVWARAKDGDPMARALYLKFKHAAVAMGVTWNYGDPWTIEPPALPPGGEG